MTRLIYQSQTWRRAAFNTLLMLAACLNVATAAAADVDPTPRVWAAVEAREFAKARSLLEQWLQNHESDQQARFLYARVLAWDGQRTAALALYDELLVTDSDNSDYLLGKAQVLVWTQQYTAALPLLQQARQLTPNYEQIWRVELQAMRVAHQYAAAEVLARTAQQKFPDSNWHQIQPSETDTPPKFQAAPRRAYVLSLEHQLRTSVLENPVAQVLVAAENQQYAEALRLLKPWLKMRPADQDAGLVYARILSWSGQLAAAITQYDVLLASGPDNTDYLLGKAQTLVWDGRSSEALSLLERAHQLAPDYEEIWRFQLQALRASGERRKARELAAKAREKFTDSNWYWGWYWGEEGAPGILMESGIVYESLDNDFSDWREHYVTLDQKLESGKSVYGRLRHSERFDNRDQELMAGVYIPVADRWTTAIEASIAPESAILPRWTLFGLAQRTLPGGYVVHGGWRHSDYQDSSVELLSASIERYWGTYHASTTLYAAIVDGTRPVFSHGAKLERYYGRRNRLGLGLGFGLQAESIGEGLVRVNRVTTISIGGTHWLNGNWSIVWDIENLQQGGLYRKRRLRVGLGRQF